jgi:hypothetical protein
VWRKTVLWGQPICHFGQRSGSQLMSTITAENGAQASDRLSSISAGHCLTPPRPLLGAICWSTQGEVIPGPDKSGLHSVDHLAIKPSVDERCDDRDISRTTDCQALRGAGWIEPEFFCSSRNFPSHGEGNRTSTWQVTRSCWLRNTCLHGDISKISPTDLHASSRCVEADRLGSLSWSVPQEIPQRHNHVPEVRKEGWRLFCLCTVCLFPECFDQDWPDIFV